MDMGPDKTALEPDRRTDSFLRLRMPRTGKINAVFSYIRCTFQRAVFKDQAMFSVGHCRWCGDKAFSEGDYPAVSENGMAASEDEIDIAADRAVEVAVFGAVAEEGILPASEGAVLKTRIRRIRIREDGDSLKAPPYHQVLALKRAEARIIEIVFHNEIIKQIAGASDSECGTGRCSEARGHAVVIVPYNRRSVASDSEAAACYADLLSEYGALREYCFKVFIQKGVENFIEVVGFTYADGFHIP